MAPSQRARILKTESAIENLTGAVSRGGEVRHAKTYKSLVFATRRNSKTFDLYSSKYAQKALRVAHASGNVISLTASKKQGS